jgi:hypothetical protein
VQIRAQHVLCRGSIVVGPEAHEQVIARNGSRLRGQVVQERAAFPPANRDWPSIRYHLRRAKEPDREHGYEQSIKQR